MGMNHSPIGVVIGIAHTLSKIIILLALLSIESG